LEADRLQERVFPVAVKPEEANLMSTVDSKETLTRVRVAFQK
jgi:hypothetical protein